MRAEACLAGVLIIVGLPMTASAQANGAFTGAVAVRNSDAVQFEDAAARLGDEIAVTAVDTPFGAPLALSGSPAGRDAFTTARSEAWFNGDGFTDRFGASIGERSHSAASRWTARWPSTSSIASAILV